MVKNCDLGLENAALGLRPRAVFSRPRSQFFTIRTSQPANNIYLLQLINLHYLTMHRKFNSIEDMFYSFSFFRFFCVSVCKLLCQLSLFQIM